MAHLDTLCGGCGRPRHETMDPAQEDQYRAEAVVCHACAARDRKLRNDSQSESGTLPGAYYAIVDDRD